MKKPKDTRNACFNFRLRSSEMDKLRLTAIQLGYISFAEFIRRAISEKIEREVNNG